MRLPGEIRNRIYDYVFRAECMVVLSSLSAPLAVRKHCIYLLYDRGARPYYLPLFALLQSQLVCRQYNAETRLLVFHNNKLAARIWDLRILLKKIPKDVQNAISTLCIYGCSDGDLTGSLLPPSSLVHFRRLELYAQIPRPSDPRTFFEQFTRKNREHIDGNPGIFLFDEWHRILIDARKIGGETRTQI